METSSPTGSGRAPGSRRFGLPSPQSSVSRAGGSSPPPSESVRLDVPPPLRPSGPPTSPPHACPTCVDAAHQPGVGALRGHRAEQHDGVGPERALVRRVRLLALRRLVDVLRRERRVQPGPGLAVGRRSLAGAVPEHQVAHLDPQRAGQVNEGVPRVRRPVEALVGACVEEGAVPPRRRSRQAGLQWPSPATGSDFTSQRRPSLLLQPGRYRAQPGPSRPQRTVPAPAPAPPSPVAAGGWTL